jgi:hypothetical protein
MFFINWGHDVTVGTEARDNAIDALALVEQYLSDKRENVKVVDRASGQPITIEELRGRAAAERGETPGSKS